MFHRYGLLVLLCFLEALLFLLELEEAFGLGVEDEDLLLHLSIGLHEAVKNCHEIAREDWLLVTDHLGYQSGLLLTEFSQSLKLHE